MVDCISSSLLLGSNHFLHSIRFSHFGYDQIPFHQTMVIHRLQPLYQMASSSAHDFFFQEANTISFVHSLISRAWRHLDVTHVPLVIQALLAMCWLKKWMLTSIECVVLDFWDARGLGPLFMVCACAVGLCGNRLTGMRGTWGDNWRSAHVPSIPFTWLRRANAWPPLRMRPTTRLFSP